MCRQLAVRNVPLMTVNSHDVKNMNRVYNPSKVKIIEGFLLETKIGSSNGVPVANTPHRGLG